ncbi:helix-turn-helix transcriptional regulator [Vibrio breoganii]
MNSTAHTDIPLIRVETIRLVLNCAQDYFPAPLMAKAIELLPSNLERPYLESIPEYAFIHFMQTLYQESESQTFVDYLVDCTAQLSFMWPIPIDPKHSTLVSVLNQVTEQFKTRSSQSEIQLELEGYQNQVKIHISTANHYENRYQGSAFWLEMKSLFFLVQYIRRLLGKDWLPLSVGLQHVNINRLGGELKLAKQGVFVDRESTFIILSEEEAYQELNVTPYQYSLPEYDVLATYHEQFASALMPYIGERKLDLDGASEILNTSRRTIQRKLNSEHTTFRKVIEQLHMQFAIRVLEDGRFSISDIASHLGYANSSKFIRAFKRITGLPPMQYAQQNGLSPRPAANTGSASN